MVNPLNLKSISKGEYDGVLYVGLGQSTGTLTVKGGGVRRRS